MNTSIRLPSTWLPRLDRLGVIASIGCAVHCLVAPVILIMAPVIGGWWTHPASHLLIASVVMPVPLFTLHRGYALHGQRWIVALGALGLALVLLGTILPFFPAASNLLSSTPDSALGHECCPHACVDAASGAWSIRVPPASLITLLGGISLVSAHIANLRSCRGCGCPSDACADE